MPKITLIGAGSAVFTRNLCSDILLAPALQDSTISLMDIDAGRLRTSRDLVQNIVDSRGLDARVEATTDRQEAIRGADYVVTTFQQGGLDAYALDIEIPQTLRRRAVRGRHPWSWRRLPRLEDHPGLA